MRTRMSGGVRGVRSNADPISIIVIRRLVESWIQTPGLSVCCVRSIVDPSDKFKRW